MKKSITILIAFIPFVGCGENKESKSPIKAGDTVHAVITRTEDTVATKFYLSDTSGIILWADSTAIVDSRIYCLVGFVQGDGKGTLISGTFTLSFDRPPTLKDIIRTLKKDKSNGWNKYCAVVSVSYFNSKSDYDNFYK